MKRKSTKRKTTKKKPTTKTSSISKKAIIERIKKHKLRFDIDYQKGIYDLTPTEADIYDDSINDIITIIRKM